MRFPKSVPEAQKYLTWSFPVLLGFGSASLFHAHWMGRVAVVVTMLVIFTGWSSYAIIPEERYNDVLLVCDIALLCCYALLLYYGAALAPVVEAGDVAMLLVSSSVFAFYSLWDLAALAARDTKALASELHLKRFAIITGGIGIMFAVSAVALSTFMGRSGNPSIEVSMVRIPLLVMWLCILLWWHYGRILAAIRDGR